MFSVGSAATGAFSGISLNEFGDLFANQWDDTGGNLQYANEGGGLGTNNVWVHITCLFDQNGFQAGWVSSDVVGSPFVNAAAQTAAAQYATINVGFQSPYFGSVPETPTSSANVQVAEVAVWKRILVKSEIQDLWTGENPLNISRANLVAYFPLRGNLNDYGPRNYALQPIGGAVATFVDHPKVSPVPTPRRAIATIAPITSTITATTKKAVANLVITLNESGTITSTTKKPATNLAITLNESGTITSTTKKPVSNVNISISVFGTIAATTKKPVTNIALLTSTTATITAVTKKPVSNLAGTINQTIIAFASTTKKPTTRLTGTLNEIATITGAPKKPQTIIFGFNGVAGSFAATTKKPTTSIAVTNTQPATFITLTSTTKKPVSVLAGRAQIVIAISSTSKKPVSALNGAMNEVGTIASTTKKPRSSLNIGYTLAFSSTIAARTKKPISSISAKTVTNFPNIVWID